MTAIDDWRQMVVDEAKTWIGTPWHHMARVKGVGVDCAQLLAACYSAVGMVPDINAGSYPRDWMLHRGEEVLVNWISKFSDRLSENKQPLSGDVAIWKYGRCFSHGGIIANWPIIIHSFKKEGGVAYCDATKGWLAEHEMMAFTKRAE